MSVEDEDTGRGSAGHQRGSSVLRGSTESAGFPSSTLKITPKWRSLEFTTVSMTQAVLKATPS